MIRIRNCQIISISGGEPLLHPQLNEVIRFIHQKGLKPWLHTNGLLLSDSKLQKLKKEGLIPHLSVILVGNNPASSIYVKMKEKACKKVGISSETIKFEKSISEKILLQKIDTLNKDPKVHGILVQLPLPSHIQEDVVIEKVIPEKDVDGFHPINLGRLVAGSDKCFFLQ